MKHFTNPLLNDSAIILQHPGNFNATEWAMPETYNKADGIFPPN